MYSTPVRYAQTCTARRIGEKTAGLLWCAPIPVKVRFGLTTSRVRRSKLVRNKEPNSFADEGDVNDIDRGVQGRLCDGLRRHDRKPNTKGVRSDRRGLYRKKRSA